MNEQAPRIQEVLLTPSNESSSSASKVDQGRKPGIPIPWSAYLVSYFIQGAIMPMILMHVTVYLKQCLGLDWLTLTAIFVIIIVPVFLRPVFAIITDRRPKSLSLMLIFGGFLVIMGSSLTGLSVLQGISGLSFITIGFTAGATGAIILNVVVDSHIIRATSLDKSAKVNSLKKITSFLGGAITPLAYIYFVGSNLSDSSAWAIYFSLPAFITIVFLPLVCFQKKTWKLLPEVYGLPPKRAKWLENEEYNLGNAKTKIILIILLASIIFLFFFPDGLFEAPWENFVVEMYGNEAWSLYNLWVIFFGIASVFGFLNALIPRKKIPEWDLLWYIPLMLGYYVMILFAPSFPIFLVVTMAFQIPSAFIQVRIFQAMQRHSYVKRAGFTFQVFMVMLQGGKFVGIGISGVIMSNGGYTGIFMATILSVLIMLSCVIVYWIITSTSRSPSSRIITS